MTMDSNDKTISISSLIFFVNGVKVTEKNANPEETIISYLRRKLQLTGTKLACGEGGCGACTVMVSSIVDRKIHKIKHMAVNACLVPLVSLHGTAIITVEGLSQNGQLHPIQDRLAKIHGSQCGFCTPGVIMSAYAALRSGTKWKNALDIQYTMQGNLCRCTGYRPIITALQTLSKSCCGNPNNCCKTTNTKKSDGRTDELFDSAKLMPFELDQEPIFPNELQLSDELDKKELLFVSDDLKWYRPTSLESMLLLKLQYPDAKIVNGNTELGIETHNRRQPYSVMIQATHIAELNRISSDKNGVSIGASCTLSDLKLFFEELIENKQMATHAKRVPKAVVEMLQWFAGPQIRNVASVGGNIMTASPISDLNPLFMAANATLTFCSHGKQRNIELNDNFFIGYRKTAVEKNEILVSIFIPFTKDNEYFFGYKQARRKEDDIAIVNAGIKVSITDNIVKSANIVYGGMATVTQIAKITSAGVVNKQWLSEFVQTATELISKDFQLNISTPGGQAAYRMTLAASFIQKFFLQVNEERCGSIQNFEIKKEVPKSSQLFDVVPDGQLKIDPIGRPIAHISAEKQSTGAAKYVDDMPKFSNELFMAPVFSKFASAEIVSINYDEALAIKGVIGVADERDALCQGSINFGGFDGGEMDETVFAKSEVTTFGQIIAVVLATDRLIARKAAGRVQVKYKNIKQPIITIADAIQHNSFYPYERRLQNGNITEALSKSAFRIDGKFYMAGQEHFYFEPNVCLIYPKEDEELEVFVSSQNPTYLQQMLSSILNIPQSKIAVRVKRLGGGFGGKETRPMLIAGPAAVCAKKFKRPIRAVLDRDDDMMISGTRHPVYAKYSLGADKDGKLTGFLVDGFLNAGNSVDMSAIVAECFVWKSLNAYFIENVDIRARLCKTNTSSNTAFRGFGAPQGMLLIEIAITELAEKMKMSPQKLREINFIKSGDVLCYGTTMANVTIQRCWFECKQLAQYDTKETEAKQFNKDHRYIKRGLFMTPICYGIGFGHKFLHQGGALVNIYTDGSVLITHGGIEMGQGLHTKLIQVASRVLNITMSKIYISETATDKVPNTSSSAASMTTDLNAPAVMHACQQLKDRLSHFMHTNPKGTWENWVASAYLEGVNLSAQGFFHGPEPYFDNKTMIGEPFIYYVHGAACTEVELDILTGHHVVRAVNIVIDLGSTLNPAIDIGQVEGAFMQGYGLYVLEDQRYTPDGRLLSKGPGAYKIPGFSDVPEEFNIHLLRGTLCEYPRSTYSSKAVGEPPLCLAVSAFMALREAVAAGREEYGVSTKSEEWSMSSPASSEILRMTVNDSLAKKFKESQTNTTKSSWETKLCH